MATVNALELIVDLDDDFGWLGLVPLVDGRGLFDDWFGVSVPADDLLLDPSPLIEGLPHRVVLRMCTCAIVGCGTAGVVISASETAVRWTNWEISLQFDDERFDARPHLSADLSFEIDRYRATVIEAVDRARPRLPSSSRSGTTVALWDRVVVRGGPTQYRRSRAKSVTAIRHHATGAKILLSDRGGPVVGGARHLCAVLCEHVGPSTATTSISSNRKGRTPVLTTHCRITGSR